MDAQHARRTRPWLAVRREVRLALEGVADDDVSRLVQELGEGGRRWFLSGQGRSGLVAQMAAMRLMHLGHEVHVVGEATAPSVRRGDGLLLVSGSGETAVSVGFARIARAEGARVVVLTTNPASRLAGLADTVVEVPVGDTEQFGGSLFEQTALLVLDGVAHELASRSPQAHAEMAHRHTNLQ